MRDTLRALILELLPPDGSTIGNQSLLAAIQERMPEVTEEEYRNARDALLANGVLGKGRGRGGSVRLIGGNGATDQEDDGVGTISDEDEAGEDTEAEADDEGNGIDENGDDDFTLTPTVESVTTRRPAASAKKNRKRTRSADGAQVVSYRHLDKRVNNPEVGMVHPENDPDKPKTNWAYDPHIDPALQFDIGRARIENLIDDALASGDHERMRDALLELKRLQEPYLTWTGKAERTSFDVDTVSLHVHERIDPASILAAIRKRLKGAKGLEDRAYQADLFDPPFENLPLRQALDFYRHPKGWSNRLIAGDSLLVMNSLLHKESMAGRVQMIYIDPPYGIKYGSNFQPFTNKRDVKDGADADLTQEPEMIKAFRDTWELGIHSYLTYLRDRLVLARELLHESGSVFVQISDENLHLVRSLLDDVFGPNNFCALVPFKKTGGQSSSTLPSVNDYIIWFCKDASLIKYPPYPDRPGSANVLAEAVALR